MPRSQWNLYTSLVLAFINLNFELQAIPLNSTLFCSSYPLAPACSENQAACQTCHAAPPTLNLFGGDLSRQLRSHPDFDKSPEAFRRYLNASLEAIASLDSDSDGISNQEEIAQGSAPGDASSGPSQTPVQSYNPELAWRRLHILFCGQSPDYASMQQFKAEPNKAAALHAALDRCLNAGFWKTDALPALADEKIRPNKAIGVEGNPFVLGDFRYDYRLFVHVMSEDRDMRELLLANYHIGPQGERLLTPIADKSIPGRTVVGNGQPLQVDRRYGMITTQWFIAINTMFAELPRNTASQAYRAYLGLDIARSEGLYPVPDEPRDVDNKGVKQEACAFCHSTLDPLAYAFAAYSGLRNAGVPVGSYDPNFSQWESWSFLFGEPVADLGEWVRKAVQSPAFQKNLTLMFYNYAVGHPPQGPDEEAEFAELWQKLPNLSYNANRLLHEMIDTRSFAGGN